MHKLPTENLYFNMKKMKKLSLYIFLVLMFCNVGFAEIIRLEKCHDSDDDSFNYSDYDNKYMVIDLDKKTSTTVTIRSDSYLKRHREAIEKAIEENPDLLLVTFNKTSIHEEKIIYSDDNIIKTNSVVQSGHMIEIDESSIDLKNYIVDKSQNFFNTATAKEYVFYSQDKCYHK